MTRLLLIGELNETMKSISEHLMSNFQVQICSENIKNVIDMIKIFRPTVLIMNVTELKSNAVTILEELNSKKNFMPFIIIANKETVSEINNLSDKFRNKRVLIRPICISDVSRTCNEMLGRVNTAYKEEENGEDNDKAKILIVDDNAIVLRNVKNILDEKYNVIIANNGEKGLEFARTRKPDLILLDYEMPGMNGSQVFAKLKEDSELCNIPVIFLTSVSEKNQIMEVMKNRPNGYILKPPAKDKLIEVIKGALK